MGSELANTKQNLHSAHDWCEYTTADFGSRLSLANAYGNLPVMIVMAEAGHLRCENSRGVDRSISTLPRWYEHRGQVAMILPSHTTPFIAYWN